MSCGARSKEHVPVAPKGMTFNFLGELVPATPLTPRRIPNPSNIGPCRIMEDGLHMVISGKGNEERFSNLKSNRERVDIY